MARQGKNITAYELKEIQDDLRTILEKALTNLEKAENEERLQAQIFMTEFKVVAPLVYRIRAHMVDWNCLSHNSCLEEMTTVQKMLADKFRFDDNRIFDEAIENAVDRNLERIRKM
jgi:hypothetical protein